MVDENKDLYTQIEEVLEQEKQGNTVKDENKQALIQQLKEMADQSNDFDPDKLESIIALTSSMKSNPLAEAVLQRATEQKNKISTPPTDENDDRFSDTPKLSEKAPIITQPSYNVYKEYVSLREKDEKQLTEQERRTLATIEEQTEIILNNIDPENINPDNSVSLKDFLDISNMNENLSEKDIERNKALSLIVEAKIKEFDKENQLDNLESISIEKINENAKKWKTVSDKDNGNTINNNLADIFKEIPQEAQQEISTILKTSIIHTLKIKEPSSKDEVALEEYQKQLGDLASEYQANVNAEYLKRQATEEFCQQNKIDEKELLEIINNSEKGINLSEKEKKIKQAFETHLSQHLEKFPDFKGPYTNKQYLKDAIIVTNANILSRTIDRESRLSRIVKAPAVSENVNKVNNAFAETHPELYSKMRTIKVTGINIAKNLALSAAIGATLGPVGLTGYSAYKTFKAINKSYKKYQENTGQGFKDYLKHLTKRENRAEMLTLIGQVAATGISAYFSVGSGLENMDFGMVGKALGHSNGHIAQAASNIASTSSSWLEAGFNKIMSTPRRAATMASSLGIGITKSLSEYSNLRHARKNLADTIQSALGEKKIDKKTLRALEKIADQQQFVAALKEIAPNMTPEQQMHAYHQAELARKSQPKTAFISAVTGATIGLVAAAAAENSDNLSISKLFNREDSQDVDAISGEAIKAENINANETPAEIAPQESEMDKIWNDEKSADQRFESFGIDAKNANEMLREMGIIKEGDNHFYRQSELAKLVNNADLTDEQRDTIQDWANDRDARVANLKAWQAAHPEPKPEPELKVDDKIAEIETPVSPEPLPTQLDPVIQKQLYHVAGRIDKLKDLQADIDAENPMAAAQQFHEQYGDVQRSSKLVLTEEDGDKTVIKQRIRDSKDIVKIKQYEDGEKVSSSKTKFYKDDEGNYESTTSRIRRDLDGDGKKDTMYVSTGKNGEVTLTEYANGEMKFEHTKSSGETTSYQKSDLVGKRGMSEEQAEMQMQNTYNFMKKINKSR